MFRHYIVIDSENRIIDGFSDYYRQPSEGDIMIAENDDREFRLLGTYKNTPLFYKPIAARDKVWLFKYVSGRVEKRTDDEIEHDMPPLYPEPSDTDVLLELTADHEERLCLLELGV